MTGLLVEEKNSWNVLYEDILELLSLKKTDLDLFGSEDLLAFDDTITCPCRAIDLTLSIREETNQRKVNLTLLVVLCKSAFKGIIGRSLLAKLDAVASTIHMKIAYHDKEATLVTVRAYL